MFANERRIQITEMLNRRSSVTVNELTDTFRVSLETIRRDLEYLEKRSHSREASSKEVEPVSRAILSSS